MKKKSRKGKMGVTVATAFINQFPLAPEGGQSPIISVATFDQWLIDNGYIPVGVECSTLNNLRNRWRGRINKTAASAYWREQGNEAFHVIVDQHGISYAITRAHVAGDLKAVRMPSQIQGYVNAKRNGVKDQHDAIDLARLSPLKRQRVEQNERTERLLIDQAVGVIVATVNGLEAGLAALLQDTARLVRTALSPAE